MRHFSDHYFVSLETYCNDYLGAPTIAAEDAVIQRYTAFKQELTGFLTPHYSKIATAVIGNKTMTGEVESTQVEIYENRNELWICLQRNAAELFFVGTQHNHDYRNEGLRLAQFSGTKKELISMMKDVGDGFHAENRMENLLTGNPFIHATETVYAEMVAPVPHREVA